MVARTGNRIANLSAELDHRLMHLGLDLLLEHDLSTLEDFLDVRPQLARLRVDNRKFLFDTERVGVVFPAHSERILNPKRCAVNATRARPANASSRRLGQISPNLSYRDRVCVRALCGSPFPILLQPPTENSPGRHWQLRHPAPGCKSRSRPERHRGLRTQPCSNRNRDIRLTAARLVRLFRGSRAACSIPFDNASDTDAAAHKA